MAGRVRIGPRVYMAAYCESPSVLPPMLHEGVALASAGFDVVSLCPVPTAAAAGTEVHARGFRTTKVRMRASALLAGGGAEGRARGALRRLLSYAEYVAVAFVHALRADADLYTAHDLPPLLPTLLAAKLRRRPIVYRAHELWPEQRARMPFAGFWRLLDRWLVPRCDLVVSPEAHRTRIYVEELGARAALTVRNCPPYHAAVPGTLLPDALRARGVVFTTIVLYQGLVDTMRCVEELAEATRLLDDGIVLVVVGGGVGKWADPAAALAPYERIVVLPRVPYDQLPRLTASADAGVLLYRDDCRNNRYCAPNKLFEYLMAGLPVVAPDHPGMRALVEGEGVGLCVDPERPDRIAAAVNRIAADGRLRGAMRAKALRLASERYNWETESRPLVDSYRALVLGGRPSLIAAR